MSNELTQEIRDYQKERPFLRYLIIFFSFLIILESIAGGIFLSAFANRLEAERKTEFRNAWQNFFKQRRAFHTTAMTGYAWWEDPWNLAKAGNWSGVRALFESDPTLTGQFDYFGVSVPGAPLFSIFGTGNSDNVRVGDDELKFLLKERSLKKGETHLIMPFGKGYAFVSASALSDVSGKPVMPGVAVFAYDFSRLLQSAQEILPCKLAISKTNNSDYLNIDLKEHIIAGGDPLYLEIEPNVRMSSIIAAALAVFMVVQILICITLFAFIAPRFYKKRTEHLEGMVQKSEKLNRELVARLEQLDAAKIEIQKSETKYRDLVESSRDMIFSLDEQGRITTMNQAVGNLLGYHAGQLIGKPFSDLIHHPTQSSLKREFVSEQIQQVIENKESVEFTIEFANRFDEPRELETRLDYVPVESGFVIFGKAGSLVEDVLSTYCRMERMTFVIANYLTLSEQISQRVTATVVRHLDPTQALNLRICVSEMIINAIEHGNLEISYEEKTKETDSGNYIEFLKERQHHPAYSGRTVTVHYALSPRRVAFLIADQGNGFDHHKLVHDNSREANRHHHLHGRGITMAKHAFDLVRYNDKGNRVLLVKKF